jgi:hypothetical protein
MIDPRAGSSAGSGAVEAALLAVAAPGRQDLAPPRLLPRGAIDLIRVAAEDRSHAEQLAVRFGVDVRRIEDAALHFVHSVMFHPDSDHFRVLGVLPDDDDDTLKLHFRWLQKWLHPDRDPEGWISVYAERVNVAWAQLRRADRRAEYRERLGDPGQASDHMLPFGPGPAALEPAYDASLAVPTLISSRWARRLPAFVIGAGVVLAVALFAAHRVGENLLAAERSARERPETVAASPGPVTVSVEVGAGRPWEVAGEEGPVSSQHASPRPPGAAPVAVVQPVASRPPFPLGSTGSAPDREPLTRKEAAGRSDAGEAAAGRQPPGAEIASGGQVPERAAMERGGARTVALPAAVEPAAGVSLAQGDSVDRSLPVALMPPTSDGKTSTSRTVLAGSPRDDPMTVAGAVDPAAAAPGLPLLAVANETSARMRMAPAGQAEPVAVTRARAGTLPDAERDRSRSPPDSVVLESPFDPSVGRRLLNQFSSAYRDGQVQHVVVLFAPNARTPEGNLVDLHQRYGSLFAASSRRSLEFLDLEWRALPNGLEGVGRYEWAMRPRGAGGTHATAGRMRVVIEFVDGRPLIVLLDQRDVG